MTHRSKRTNQDGLFDLLIAPSFRFFFWPSADTQFQREPRQRRGKIHGGEKILQFSTEIAVYFITFMKRKQQIIGDGSIHVGSDDIEWPLTQISRSQHVIRHWISQKQHEMEPWLYRTSLGSRMRSIEWWMVPLSMTLSDSDPDFKVMTFLKLNIGKMARPKEKIKLLYTNWNYT